MSLKQIIGIIGSTGVLTACASHLNIESNVQADSPVSTVKPGAAIEFSYEVSKDLVPAEFGKLTLSFREGYDAGTLRLEVQADEGLRLVSEVMKKEFSMTGDTPHEWELDVTALQEGVYYLNILASVDLFDGRDSGRAFSARIEVGDITSPNARQSVKQNGILSSGGTTVIMEAEEVIK